LLDEALGLPNVVAWLHSLSGRHEESADVIKRASRFPSKCLIIGTSAHEAAPALQVALNNASATTIWLPSFERLQDDATIFLRLLAPHSWGQECARSLGLDFAAMPPRLTRVCHRICLELRSDLSVAAICGDTSVQRRLNRWLLHRYSLPAAEHLLTGFLALKAAYGLAVLALRSAELCEYTGVSLKTLQRCVHAVLGSSIDEVRSMSRTDIIHLVVCWLSERGQRRVEAAALN
jgi:hypothetical protein